jgi:integrase/recombinase XerC
MTVLLRRRPAMPDTPAAVAAHLEHLRLRGLAPATVYERRKALARMQAVIPVPLLEASEADLMAWRAGLKLSDYATSAYVSHAKEFYRWAAAQGLIGHSPAERLPVPPRRRGLPRPVAEDDLFAALEQAPPRVRPLLVLAAWCGLRARELALLRREDILDHAVPPVLVVSRQAGKGRRERIVPLSGFVLAELAAAGLPSHGWVFPRLDGQSGHLAPWRVSQLAAEALHRAGIAATLHQLRHRYGSQIYHLTHDLRLTQELLGHATPATTAIYAAWDKAAAVAAAETLPCPDGAYHDSKRPRTVRPHRYPGP